MPVRHDPKTVKKLLDELKRTTDSVVTFEALEKLLLSGKQLRMKYGVDVTAPTLHIGHAVNLWMYRKLQDLGHKVVFLIGDFTTQIGDPTGRDKRRPVISDADIKKNAREFIKQATMVLKADKPVFEIRRNSEWFSKMKAKDLLQLMSQVTHEKLIARDMFKKRIAEKKEIYMHEMVYPLLQGYDSVELESDLTIIGSDQLFNEMMGRFYQDKMGQTPQVILTSKITPGIDGKEKQSKSLGNYIGLQHEPQEKFRRVMSIPDNLVEEYFSIYTDVPVDSLAELNRLQKKDPLAAKKRLAFEIVARYHGKKIAQQASVWFETRISKKEGTDVVATSPTKNTTAFELVKQANELLGMKRSGSEVRRLFAQHAISINGTEVTDLAFSVVLDTKKPTLVKIGKMVVSFIASR
jgi:tyrosyl-tRNA synthetase